MVKTKSKKTPTTKLEIGTRVKHATDKKLIEGVIVWRHSCVKSATLPSINGREWSVHWSCGERGIYNTSDITKIQPRNLKEIVEKELKKEMEETEDV